MRTEVHEIDLLKAKDWLAKNLPYTRGEDGTNRPVSRRKVNQYAIDMLRGKWRLTHQGMAFDKAGHLKDGQHRLLALVQAAEEGAIDGEEILKPKPRIKVQIQVTWGLEDNVFEVLDTGLPRTANQILAIAGYANQIHLAAAARLLYCFDHHEFKFWRSVKVTNQEILETVRATRLDEYLPSTSPLTPVGFIPAATTVGYFVCERAYPAGPHEEWLYALQTGEDLKVDDPRSVLRNYTIRSKGQPRVRRDAYSHLALYILAWNDYVGGKKRNAISWRTNTDFPRPIEK